MPIPLIAAIAGMGLNMAGGIVGGLAQRQAEKQNARDAKLNAILANMQANDVLAMAEQQVGDIRTEGESMKSAQLASMAAQGVDVSSGVPQELLTDTNVKVAEDIRRTRETARKQAWGLQAEGMQQMTQASRARSRGRYALMGGLLGAGGSAAQGVGQIAPMLPNIGK